MFAENTLTARTLAALRVAHKTNGFLFWAPAAVLVAFLVIAVLFDAPVSRTLIGWPEHERAFFEFVTDFGKSDWILIPTLLGALLGLGAARLLPLTYKWKWAARALGGTSAFIFLGVGVPGLVSAILKRVIGRARPMHLDEYGAMHFEPFDFLDWTMQAFPSGHSTTGLAFTVVMITLLNGRFRGTLIAIGVGIGLSRIVGSYHFLTDVLAGMAWGTVGALMVRDYFVTRNWGLRLEGRKVRFRLFSGFKPLWRKFRRGQVPALRA